VWAGSIKELRANFALHPLIHTHPDFKAAQDVEKKKAEPKTPHFLAIYQDIVACSQKQKWGLKYVMFSPGRPGFS
jgi:hypothetical protein